MGTTRRCRCLLRVMTVTDDRMDAVAKVAPIPLGKQLLPEDVERLLAELGNRITVGGLETGRALEAYVTARREFDFAYARAYLAHEGPQTEKRHAATTATEVQRTAMDVAEVTYKTYQSQMKALETAMSAVQSIGASVRQMIQGSTGTGW